jgi:hypothetical protein
LPDIAFTEIGFAGEYHNRNRILRQSTGQLDASLIVSDVLLNVFVECRYSISDRLDESLVENRMSCEFYLENRLHGGREASLTT